MKGFNKMESKTENSSNYCYEHLIKYLTLVYAPHIFAFQTESARKVLVVFKAYDGGQIIF